jgi:hypothetical protein
MTAASGDRFIAEFRARRKFVEAASADLVHFGFDPAFALSIAAGSLPSDLECNSASSA